MHMRQARVLVLCAAVLVFGPATWRAAAQISQGTSAARAQFNKGVAALRRSEPEVALAAFRKAIELDDAFFDAHQEFVSTTLERAGDDRRGQANDELRTLYEGWLQAQPRNAVLYYFLGTLETDPSKADPDFQKAIELAPGFAQPYQRLGLDATMRGENQQASEWLKKAADAAPDNPEYLFDYAYSLADRDPASWTRVALSIADRFPGTQVASEALYWLGQKAASAAQAVNYFERLRRDYPPARYSWSESAMASLFDIYSRSDPGKALALASEMVDQKVDSYLDWRGIAAMEENVVSAQRLVEQKRPAEALDTLENTDAPNYVRVEQLTLGMAQAEDALGRVQQAYDRLVDLAARQPSEDVLRALAAQARRLKKSDAQLRQDLRARRARQATLAQDFTFVNPLDGSRVSLSKYRGKVVLLSFWSPACAVCRGQFSLLQRTLEKYSGRFVVVAVNVDAGRDALVAPFISNNRYGFVALDSPRDWASASRYKVIGTPSNFLIDQRGRIVFTPRVYNSETERRLQLEIEALLEPAPPRS
jgi:Tfp pilus assembly protein PilF/thiol-disulfide isomerase/thioredoxin